MTYSLLPETMPANDRGIDGASYLVFLAGVTVGLLLFSEPPILMPPLLLLPEPKSAGNDASLRLCGFDDELPSSNDKLGESEREPGRLLLPLPFFNLDGFESMLESLLSELKSLSDSFFSSGFFLECLVFVFLRFLTN